MDNQNYLGSNKREPGMPTATAGKMNLEAVAKGCGFESACTVEDAAAFHRQDPSCAFELQPRFLPPPRQPLDNDAPKKSKRVPDPRESKEYQFAGYVRKPKGVEILGSGLGGG